MIEKKDPKMEAQKFLEYVGSKDLTKMDKAIADELQMIVKKVKANMDNPEMVMPLVQKGMMLCKKAEEGMEMEKPMAEMENEQADVEEDKSEYSQEPKKEYKAIDAINEIKAILGKVKEVE